MNRYRFQKIDCVVLELDLPDTSGFQVFTDLIPIVSRPKTHTSHEDLDHAIRHAVRPILIHIVYVSICFTGITSTQISMRFVGDGVHWP